MTARYQEIAYYNNRAYFSVKQFKSGFEKWHYNIILCISIEGARNKVELYELLKENWLYQDRGFVGKNVDHLTSNNYLTKKGTKYHLTDKSMLLIAQVERKLKALVALHVGSNPVGRPKKEK